MELGPSSGSIALSLRYRVDIEGCVKAIAFLYEVAVAPLPQPENKRSARLYTFTIRFTLCSGAKQCLLLSMQSCRQFQM